MKGIELALDEAAELLGYSPDCVIQLVDRRVLSAQGDGSERRIPLQSLARFVGINAENVAVRGMRRVLEDDAAWARVFASHPRAQSASGPIGRALRRAIAIAEIRHA